MINKADRAKSKDDQNETSIHSSQKVVTDNIVKLPESSIETVFNSPRHQVGPAFKQLSLTTKATILAIVIGTLPILGIGTLAYQIASKSITRKIAQIQTAEAKGLADKVNRFMIERYRDLEFMDSMPIFANPRLRDYTTPKEKQAALDKLIDAYAVYDSIGVFDLQGEPIVINQSDEADNHRDRDYFQKVLESDRPFISQPEVSKDTKLPSIYTAAPIKDTVTGKTIGIIRARMPVKPLEDLLKNYTGNGRQYFLSDASGKIFVSSAKNQINGNATAYFPGLNKQQATKPENSFSTTYAPDNRENLVSYASNKLDGLPDLKWQVILATDTATAFEPQRQLLLTIAIGTGLTALIVALVAAWLAKLATKPIVNATQAVAKLGQGELETRLEVQSEDELGVLSANINQMAAQLQTLLKDQELDAERVKLLAEITLRTRRSLKVEDIYKTAVREVRQALKTDRVVIYQFNPETWDGKVIAEAVTAGLPRMSGVEIDDPCFQERHAESYKDGRVRAINNIYQDPNLSNSDCYIRMLEKFAVKANLVAPVISNEKLVALMIAHHCDSPRIVSDFSDFGGKPEVTQRRFLR